MRFRRPIQLFLIAAAAALLVFCSTVPDEIEEGLSPLEYFQRAQEASDVGRFQLSMAYYEKFQEQYPDELDRNVWAEYEIALLYYKMKEPQTALERFEALLARYDAGEPNLPDGPEILARKVKARIEEELAPEVSEEEGESSGGE